MPKHRKLKELHCLVLVGTTPLPVYTSLSFTRDANHLEFPTSFKNLLPHMCSEGYCSWVCLCVCLSVKSNLTSGASVRPENTVTYSVGNEGQKICVVFSETAPFKSYGVFSLLMTSYVCTAVTFRALFRQKNLLRILKRLTTG